MCWQSVLPWVSLWLSGKAGLPLSSKSPASIISPLLPQPRPLLGCELLNVQEVIKLNFPHILRENCEDGWQEERDDKSNSNPGPQMVGHPWHRVGGGTPNTGPPAHHLWRSLHSVSGPPGRSGRVYSTDTHVGIRNATQYTKLFSIWYKKSELKVNIFLLGDFPVVQWLRLKAPNAGAGFNPRSGN